MYILELFAKILSDFNKRKKQSDISENIEDDENSCNHIFVPVDSTKEVLACSKCGLLIKKSDIEKNKIRGNFFVKS